MATAWIAAGFCAYHLYQLTSIYGSEYEGRESLCRTRIAQADFPSAEMRCASLTQAPLQFLRSLTRVPQTTTSHQQGMCLCTCSAECLAVMALNELRLSERQSVPGAHMAHVPAVNLANATWVVPIDWVASSFLSPFLSKHPHRQPGAASRRGMRRLYAHRASSPTGSLKLNGLPSPLAQCCSSHLTPYPSSASHAVFPVSFFPRKPS